jgi:hypothetical protein
MSWSKAGSGTQPGGGAALAALAAGAVLVILGSWWGFAFYAPQKGHLAQATAQAAETSERRDRVRVEVSEAMAPGGTGRPTLASVVEFFALEDDTLPCTVEQRHGEAAQERAARFARRPLPVGTPVTLCLD